MPQIEGIVYVLTNETMPDLVKIGFTTRELVQQRMDELSRSTSVPVPFDCAYAARVSDCKKVEQALHNAFGPQRLNPKREFFAIEADQAIGIIQLLEIENVTPEVAQDIDENLDEADRQSKKTARKRKPNLNFLEMNIPLGASLTSPDGKSSCKIVSGRKVEFNGVEMSLTAAARDYTGKEYLTNPCPWWMFKGKSLSEIYHETYD